MPLQLNVQSPAGARAVPLLGTLSIGRAPDNDVVLDDPDVSRHHASLAPSATGAVFMDLGSANGSVVNGAEIEPRVPVNLRPGDRVVLASFVLAIGQTAVGAPAAAPAPPPAPPVAPDAGSTMVLRIEPRLEIATPGGQRTVLLKGDEMTLGREADNAIVVESDVVSRHHLRLRRTGDTYRVEDLGTTNGVRVAGVRVNNHVLRDGDVLDIAGEVLLRYRLASSMEEPPHDYALPADARPTITIGRAPSCEMRLTHPTISQLHARLTRDARGQPFVEDLGSTNGTFVNGVRLERGQRRALGPGDVLQVGPLRLHLGDRGGIRQEDYSRNIRLTATHLHQRVSDKLDLLQDISIVIDPAEFVAVVGVSGSGKSTLLGALSGLRPASDGDVVLNSMSLYRHFDEFRTALGYVPQDDILHRELPVGRALRYAADLRLPDDTPREERASRIASVVQTLGLQDRVSTPVGRLSGGQRKRVSIGAELLTEPGLFFLDEATSGLDPGTESQLMRLLRRLADEGHTIVLITHATKNVMLCDQVLFLARGGHLAYFGPPDEALSYFGVDDFDGIYEKLEAEKSPAEWGQTYRASPQYRDNIVARLRGQQAALAQAAATANRPVQRSAPARSSSGLRQLFVLSRRYFDIMRRDRVNFALLFLLAPILGLVDLVAWPGNVLDRKEGLGSRAMTMLFLSSLIPFLVGALSYVREIVKEAPIYARERAVSLGVWPYLGSKVIIGTFFALYHAAALVAIKVLLIDIPGADSADYFALYITVALNVLSGIVWALLISTVTSREEQSMMLIIGLIVILGVVFSGGLVPLSDMGPAGVVFSALDSTAWTFKGLTAAVGLTTDGCSGDFANCNIPGISGYETQQERALAFKGVNDNFGDIFDAEIAVCWAAMAGLLAVLMVVLYVLQRRKDVL